MATPIPAFVSQILLDSTTTTITVTQGANSGSADFSVARWYYYISNRTTASNGQSFLKAFKDVLEAAGAAATPAAITAVWTVRLGSDYKLWLTHDSGSSITITVPAALAAKLGAGSTTSWVAAVSTGYPVGAYSQWWWTPDQPISLTGPASWDPVISYGVPHAAGSAQRAPDGTTAYTDNGVLYDAELVFNSVQPYYKIRPQTSYTNYDLETWWTNGPRKGRRCLMWRDRDNAVGSNAPSEGSATPYNYLEFAPQPDLQRNFPAVSVLPELLTYWNVRLPFWVTENGETPLTD